MLKEKPVQVRKVLKMNSTYYISIPRPFIERHEIKKGERVAVVDGVELIKILPLKNEQ